MAFDRSDILRLVRQSDTEVVSCTMSAPTIAA